jgi:catechol 2,3-dioxygenase-like lactoylglutathione lyase family enzyme
VDRIEVLPHHCGMSVSDLDEAVDWFERVLGFELDRREDFLAAQGVHIAFVRNGDFYIELFQHDRAEPASPERSIPKADIRTLGNKHMCFRIPDMAAMLERLQINRVDVALGPFEAPGATACFVHGPDDALIELIQLH